MNSKDSEKGEVVEDGRIRPEGYRKFCCGSAWYQRSGLEDPEKWPGLTLRP